jgi:Tol biopolymer transport system component
MRNQRNIGRFIALTLALALSLAAKTLPINSTYSAHAATYTSRAMSNDQSASEAVTNGKIVFGRNGELFTMNADGSDPRQLPFALGSEPSLASLGAIWSPDGTKIAFVRSTTTTFQDRNQICVMNADGSNQKCPSGEDAIAPAWSPDSTQIVFTKNLDIYAMNADGSNQRNLTNFSANHFGSGPSWSPDGLKIAFARTDRNTSFVLVMNADGSNQRVILNGGLFDHVWSPDGLKLLVRPAGLKGIWVVNADGSNVTKLHEPTPLPGAPNVSDHNPAWSPDGSKLALVTLFCDSKFCLDDFGSSNIIVVDADGSHPTPGAGGWAWSFTWSPDGRKIMFDDERVENPGLFVMNADGSGLNNVTNGGGGIEPSWQAIRSVFAIDDSQFFVRQHYRDFLNREPDADGLAYWTAEILSCGGDAQCIEAKRINVSAAYFLSIEFQQTGYFVYRIYKAAYGNLPNAPVPIRFNEFLSDTQQVSQGVIVNQAGWEQLLENNTQTFTSDFVQRSRFTSAFPASLTPTEFVDKLYTNAGLTASGSVHVAAINEFGSSQNSADVAARARALRRLTENASLAQQEFNRAFVLMQYFGYLRRNPNDLPDTNFDGYNFWLTKLNQFNGNFVQAEMVKAFLLSTEYRQRFVLMQIVNS